ncbi:phytanoyl-CoA dioxygenase family protein [Alteriqipengyuania sp. 357]
MAEVAGPSTGLDVLPEVACLEQFHAALVRGGPQLAEMTSRLLLDTLALGNKEVYQFLHRARPSFDEFRAWIIATAGPPDPALLARYHAWLRDMPLEGDAKAALMDIAAMPPVLDEAALRFWDEHGYVVLTDAVPAEDIAAILQLVWDSLGATPDDPRSWYAAETDGIMIPVYRHAAIAAARNSARVHKAFAQLWGSENLWCTIDRIGFNPPETPAYRFAGSDLHWDVSLARPIPFGTQGVLYLTDTSEDQGAFRCVPGFHRRIDAWLDGIGAGDPRAVDLSREEKRIAASAGDLIIWRQDLPHGASPNRSDRPRLVQYLNYYSPDMPIRSQWR